MRLKDCLQYGMKFQLTAESLTEGGSVTNVTIYDTKPNQFANVNALFRRLYKDIQIQRATPHPSALYRYDTDKGTLIKARKGVLKTAGGQVPVVWKLQVFVLLSVPGIEFDEKLVERSPDNKAAVAAVEQVIEKSKSIHTPHANSDLNELLEQATKKVSSLPTPPKCDYWSLNPSEKEATSVLGKFLHWAKGLLR